MQRVVPSQVVELIDVLFPDAASEVENQPLPLGTDHSRQLSGILDLIRQVPPELIVLKAAQYAEYVVSMATIRWWVERWQVQERPSPAGPILIPGLRRHSPVALIRQALAKCPDEFPAAATAELTFITDAALREGLRKDISTANVALINGEWKSATVLAGSVIEALLLWALGQRPSANVQSAIAKLVGTKLAKSPPANLDEWVLYQYIEVASELNVISGDTATAARLAKDFRNLIHPGRAQRLGQVCNRGTALSAVAAFEHVVNDLMP